MSDVKVTRRAQYDPVVARQDQQESLDRNIPAPWRTGKLISNIEMVPGTDRRVSHGLKHRLVGWLLIRPRFTGGAHVFELADQASTTTIVLRCDGPITFDLWVW